MSRDFKTIKNILNNIVKENNLYNDIKNEELKRNWDKIVGKKIADITQPQIIEKNVLFLKVKNSIWRQELSLKHTELIELINKSRDSYKIKKITFL